MVRIIKGLVLKQPWAQLVAEGTIPFLIRPMKTTIRGRIGIISAGLDEMVQIDGEIPTTDKFPIHVALGSVIIHDCRKVSNRRIASVVSKEFGEELWRFYPKHFISRYSNLYIWYLKKPKLYSTIISIGHRNVRNWVRLNYEEHARIKRIDQ